MNAKLVVAIAFFLASISSLAQVQPAASKGRALPLNFSAGGGLDYFSGDYKVGDINR
jgi:hypothetical protein